MTAIVSPRRTTLFSDRPRGQVQADLLDAQLHNLIEAIASTQRALQDIRRDDGKLHAGSVGSDQLAIEIKHTRAEMDTIESRVVATAEMVTAAAAEVAAIARDIHLRAIDAETAAQSVLGGVSVVQHNVATATDAVSDAENSADRAESAAIDAKNSASFSDIQAKNAMAEEQMAGAWAEYLAGPVVDHTKAPAYISGSPWGSGLYYQPVEGMGGVGGLWSAKWWSLRAQQLVGSWGFYYLGAWPSPPLPGSINPDTGQSVPTPILEGSFYYDLTAEQLYIWNGSAWVSPFILTPGYQNTYVYIATSNQTVFSGADVNGATPYLEQAETEVHLNGIKLVALMDYTVDVPTSTLTLFTPAPINSIVQWDLLVPADQLASGAVDTLKGVLSPVPDGTTTIFTMSYQSQPISVTDAAQVQVNLDGVTQEPHIDYSAMGGTLTMAEAPPAGARFWILWFAKSLEIAKKWPVEEAAE